MRFSTTDGVTFEVDYANKIARRLSGKERGSKIKDKVWRKFVFATPEPVIGRTFRFIWHVINEDYMWVTDTMPIRLVMG